MNLPFSLHITIISFQSLRKYINKNELVQEERMQFMQRLSPGIKSEQKQIFDAERISLKTDNKTRTRTTKTCVPSLIMQNKIIHSKQQ